jgi:guanyl-specific ribonuclease Sa
MKRRFAALIALFLAGLLILAGCGKNTAGTVAAPAAPAAAEVTTAFTVVTAAPEKEAAATKEQTAAAKEETAPEEEAGPITDPQGIADYLFAHGELPPNFITKAEAQALGWDGGDLSRYAPGKSIGGDTFGNYEGQLPKAKGRKFRECDVRYSGGKRGAERIVYSNDGHVWYTADHYETFTELFPSKE